MTNASQPSPSGPPRQRLLRVVLFVSLALNLLVGGLVLGAVVGRDGPMHDRHVMLDLSFGPYTRALASEDRAALREAWRTHAPGWRDLRETQRAEFETFVGALRAEPFERQQLDAVMERQQARQTAQRALAWQILSDHLAAMPAHARATYADRLSEAASRNGSSRPERTGRD